MPKTVLVLAPHPDDAEFFAGGTLAKMAGDGDRVLIAIATDGRKGSFVHSSEELVTIRRQEAIRGAAALGAERPLFLGHPDLELDALPPGRLREQFIRLIRQLRPDVLVAEDAFHPAEVHPDHRAVAWAASDAVSFAALPLQHPEHRREGLEPHFVPEKYFYRSGPEGANRIVDIGGTIDRKLAALAEHRSQVEFLVEEVMAQARAAGVDLGAILGEGVSDPMQSLAWAMRAEAAQVGQAAGVEYGEAFRYARFHPLVEGLLAAGG